jgi:hypothetical protein
LKEIVQLDHQWRVDEYQNDSLHFTYAWLAVSLALGLEPGYGQQQPDGATVKGKQSRCAIGATDDNIRHGSQPNDRDATTLEAPPEKGGPETRGPSCRIHIDTLLRGT